VLVLGIDIGGTSTRALVTTVAGDPVGFGSAGAGNPVTVPEAEATANLRAALAAALSGVDPAGIRAVVAGAAGASRAEPVERTIRDAGVGCPVRVVGDAVTAFAAGTDEPAGTVLVAGTGAVAARVENGSLVRTADGLGWLLGDLGSAFWIGREAAVATADRHYDGTPETPLTRAVGAALGAGDETGRSTVDGDRIVAAVYRREPRALAALAPLVADAAGDPLATAILDRAAAHLHATVLRVLGDGPLVLAGGVLRHCGPVRDGLLSRLGPRVRVTLAGPGEVGAARVAARSLTVPGT
jgi:N-acetylglucosamine kinase-like BadF-type ATPase